MVCIRSKFMISPRIAWQPARTCSVRKHQKTERLQFNYKNTTTYCRQHRATSFHTITIHLLSKSGIERMTPLPVPIHSRLHVTNRQLIRTNEKPRLPAPVHKPTSNILIDAFLIICSCEPD